MPKETGNEYKPPAANIPDIANLPEGRPLADDKRLSKISGDKDPSAAYYNQQTVAGSDYSKSKVVEQENHIPDTHKLRLFRQSFSIAEGEPGVQRRIMRLWAKEGFLDEFDIPRDPPDEAYTIPIPRIHPEVLEEEIDLQVDRRWTELYEAKYSPKTSDEDLPQEIFTRLIKQEIRYQTMGREGRGTVSGAIPDSIHDPYASVLRQYLVMGKKAPYPPNEAVYRAIQPYMDEQLANYKNPAVGEQGDVGTLVQLWESNHPGESFIPPSEATISLPQQKELSGYAQNPLKLDERALELLSPRDRLVIRRDAAGEPASVIDPDFGFNVGGKRLVDKAKSKYRTALKKVQPEE